jgi:hypothetical protein
MYQNAAGEQFSVSRLQYFLSGIVFYRGGDSVYAVDTVAYIDARKDYIVNIAGVPAFSYDSVSYVIGVPPARNAHGALAPTFENVAMEWPEVMGGGYHFLKLEGYWQDGGAPTGYSMHLGTNPALVRGGFRTAGSVAAGAQHKVSWSMDVAEWMTRPHVFSFDTDGVYTMGNAALMRKVSENGRDVINLKP